MKNPEHQKIHAVKDQSQSIGDFMEWLEEKGIVFAHYDGGDFLAEYPFQTKEKWLAEFFDIDLDKIEEEKLAMIEELKH